MNCARASIAAQPHKQDEVLLKRGLGMLSSEAKSGPDTSENRLQVIAYNDKEKLFIVKSRIGNTTDFGHFCRNIPCDGDVSRKAPLFLL